MTVNYDEQAGCYEKTRGVIPLVYSTLFTILCPKANEKILDFGCGTGSYLSKLSIEYSIVPYGVEPSSAMREIAIKKNPTALIVEGNHMNIPINVQFDCIYCTDVIHHIDDLSALFLNLFNVSKPGARLCICTESHNQLKEKFWIKFFPEIPCIDLKRFHKISEIISKGISIGWEHIKTVTIEEEVNETISDNFMLCIMEKTLSVLRLLPEESYRYGLNQMRHDYECKKVFRQKEGYSFVVFKKGN